MAPVLPYLAVAATAVSAVGAYGSAQAQGQAAAYQSKVAANNAIIAQQNKVNAEQAGAQAAETTSMKGAAQLGQIRAAIGANNIDVNTGSAANVQTSQREVSNLDTQTTMNNALLQAYGYQSQATGYSATAGLQSYEAGQAPVAEAGGVAGSLLSGAKAIPDKYINQLFGTS